MAQRASPVHAYQFAETCRRRGRLDLWRQAVECAFALPHDSPEEIFHRGSARLLLGDWRGWTDLEARILDPSAGYLESRYVRQLRFNTVAWDGRADIRSKTLYLIADGQLGDCIQMLRYLPALAARSGRIVLDVPPELIALVRKMYGKLVTVTLRGIEQTIPYDRYAWMLSLPALVGELPLFEPLLIPPAITRACMPSEPRIGVCWCDDAEKPPDIAQLLALEEIDWYSLRGEHPVASHPRLSSPSTPVYSLAQTAAFVATLDAVVTFDTPIAHLAGAIGTPTWLLLNAGAHPRWGLQSRTPWYPSLRLLRQPAMGEWQPVLEELLDEIRTWRSR